MDEHGAELVITWFVDLENRFCELLKIIPINESTEDVFLPTLSSMILEACSLLDTVLRDGFQGHKASKDATIVDFALDYEPRLQLSTRRSMLFQFPTRLMSPFDGWIGPAGDYQPLDWWQYYNALKHDRLANFSCSTIRTTLRSMCALHQLIASQPSFLEPLVRRDMICCQKRDLEHLLAEVRGNSEAVHTGVVESALFGTPIGKLAFPPDVERIDPHQYGGRKLPRFL